MINNFEKNFNKDRVLSSVIEILQDKEMSIADIQKKLKIKRSTLIYYLNILESRGIIEKNRIEEKKTGRPTMIKIRKEKIKEMKERAKKNREYTLEILKTISKKGGEILANENLYLLLPPDKKREDWGERFKALSSVLYVSDLVDNIIRINEKGRRFLKEN